MNLIGHLACAPPDAPELQLGALLPDLLGIFRRRPRVVEVVKLWGAAPPPEIGRVIAGIRFHYYVDARFHRAPLFLHHAGGLRAAMDTTGPGHGLKRFFAAHLLTELYFDHLLLAERPALSGDFYRLLEGESRELLAEFAGRHPEVERAGLEAFVERMHAERFLEGYRSRAGVVARVNRVVSRYRQRTLSAGEEEAVSSYFEAHEQAALGPLLQFVAAMQEWEGFSLPDPESRPAAGETLPAADLRPRPSVPEGA